MIGSFLIVSETALDDGGSLPDNCFLHLNRVDPVFKRHSDPFGIHLGIEKVN